MRCCCWSPLNEWSVDEWEMVLCVASDGISSDHSTCLWVWFTWLLFPFMSNSQVFSPFSLLKLKTWTNTGSLAIGYLLRKCCSPLQNPFMQIKCIDKHFHVSTVLRSMYPHAKTCVPQVRTDSASSPWVQDYRLHLGSPLKSPQLKHFGFLLANQCNQTNAIIMLLAVSMVTKICTWNPIPWLVKARPCHLISIPLHTKKSSDLPSASLSLCMSVAQMSEVTSPSSPSRSLIPA